MDRARFFQRIVGGENAIDRPGEINCRRTRVTHAPRRIAKDRVVGDRAAKQRDAVGTEDADARRAAHRQTLDGVDDIVNGARAFVACLMRKQTLVEIDDRVAVPGNDGQTPAGTCAV